MRIGRPALRHPHHVPLAEPGARRGRARMAIAQVLQHLARPIEVARRQPVHQRNRAEQDRVAVQRRQGRGLRAPDLGVDRTRAQAVRPIDRRPRWRHRSARRRGCRRRRPTPPRSTRSRSAGRARGPARRRTRTCHGSRTGSRVPAAAHRARRCDCGRRRSTAWRSRAAAAARDSSAIRSSASASPTNSVSACRRAMRTG